jgi:hypothetical protein
MSLMIEGVEFQSLTVGRWFDVVEGGRFDVPVYRGINTVVPGRAGQTRRNHVADHLPIRLHGRIWGDGATAALRRASFASRMAAALTALGTVGTNRTIVAHPPNEALAVGQTATIEAQFERIVSGPPRGWEEQQLEIEFSCIATPPVWVIA